MLFFSPHLGEMGNMPNKCPGGRPGLEKMGGRLMTILYFIEYAEVSIRFSQLNCIITESHAYEVLVTGSRKKTASSISYVRLPCIDIPFIPIFLAHFFVVFLCP